MTEKDVTEKNVALLSLCNDAIDLSYSLWGYLGDVRMAIRSYDCLKALEIIEEAENKAQNRIAELKKMKNIT